MRRKKHTSLLPPFGRRSNPHRRRVRREEKIREEAVLRERIFIPIRFSGRERSEQENLQPEKMKFHFLGGRRPELWHHYVKFDLWAT